MKPATVCLCLAAAASAPAATAWAQPAIALQMIACCIPKIVALTHAGDGSGRLFITRQDGRISIFDGCALRVAPFFLDISDLVRDVDSEQGLLSVAFHPNYPATPYFFVYYTREPDGDLVIARYRVSAGNPNVADPASAAIMLVIEHSANSNHNGGQLQFGPDGYLYIGTGDGGSGNDPPCNAQRTDTLLGKMLRIDVDQNVNTPPYYGIPPTNPFLGPGDPLDEIWATGLRNPWRFSFDRLTGDLFIGDVGQSAREEVDFQPAVSSGGENWGWKIKEGTLCTGNTGGCTNPASCADPSLLDPILEYSHSVGCSITGGYRYRGSQIAGLTGHYIYGDYCSGAIFAGHESGGAWSSTTLSGAGFSISTFGEDEAGELYVAQHHLGGGAVYRIVPAVRQANLSITKTDGQTTVTAGSPIAYGITVGNAGPVGAHCALVNDSFPAALQNVNWTCSASPGSSCCGATGGSGDIVFRPVMVLPGGAVTFTATATVDPGATGTLSNTATVAEYQCVTDPTHADNVATDVDQIFAPADLAVTKTDGETTAAPGQARTYTIVVTNNGPSPVTGATVTDDVPASLTGATWTCVGAGGGTCTAVGAGNIDDTVNLPVGATVTYTLTGIIDPAATGSLSNTATVAPPGGVTDPVPGNNSATDTDALIACGDEIVVVPDGRLMASTLPAGAHGWFGASVRIGSSYSVELKNLTGNVPPGMLTVFAGDDGCTGTSSLVTNETSAVDPAGTGGIARVSFTAAGAQTFFRARLVNTTGAPVAFSVSWSDTTLFSPAWSDNGGFDTFYSFQNTTGATLHGTLTLLNPSGTVVMTHGLTIASGETASTNTAALGIPRNQTGTAKFVHDGPPGVILAEAAIANFSTNPAYVQPVKFQAAREAK